MLFTWHFGRGQNGNEGGDDKKRRENDLWEIAKFARGACMDESKGSREKLFSMNEMIFHR
jgi:hypothetical protein